MIARFTKGGYTLDLTTSPYSLGSDFIPPAPALVYDYAGGTSANVMGGADVASYKAQNREWGFSVRILAASEAAVNQAVRRLSSFLAQALDNTDPMYFEFQPLDLPAPLWGQLGAPLCYEVVTASTSLGDMYTSSRARQQGAKVGVSLVIKPLALSRKQHLASVLGGIIEERLGSADGMARGLRVMEATTNKMTNPVFGYSTWNNGWTAAANIIEAKNEDPHYCFEGSYVSAFLTSRGGTNNTYTQSITAGNTNKHSFSAIVARPDGAAVTSADCQIYYGAAKTTTFESLGNGLYLAYSDNITGINAATATGLLIASGRQVYLLAYQMEELTYHTPITYGDLLGSAWTGTAHASTSTRTAGRVRLSVAGDTFQVGSWAVHLIWEPDYASTATGNRYLFSCGAASIRAYFNGTDDKIYLTDNVNTISSAAQTFSARDKLDLIFCGGPSGLAMYKNGASIASGATYTVPASPTYLYIGTDDSAANHAGGLLQAETYSRELTSAEASAIYTTVSAIIAAGRRVSSLPVFWTKDGDDALDNCDDSTRDNWGVVLGVPGDLPASTELNTTYAVDPSEQGCHFSSYASKSYASPTNYFNDQSGAADATCAGGAYHAYTLDTTEQELAQITVVNSAARNAFGNELYLLVRLRESALTTNIQGMLKVRAGNSTLAVSDWETISTTTTHKLYRIGHITMPGRDTLAAAKILNSNAVVGIWSNIAFSFYAKRASGSSDIYVDYCAILVGDTAYVTGVIKAMTLLDGEAIAKNVILYPYLGNTIQFEPNAYNHLVTLLGANGGASDITQTTQVTIYVTPRWSLI